MEENAVESEKVGFRERVGKSLIKRADTLRNLSDREVSKNKALVTAIAAAGVVELVAVVATTADSQSLQNIAVELARFGDQENANRAFDLSVKQFQLSQRILLVSATKAAVSLGVVSMDKTAYSETIPVSTHVIPAIADVFSAVGEKLRG